MGRGVLTAEFVVKVMHCFRIFTEIKLYTVFPNLWTAIYFHMSNIKQFQIFTDLYKRFPNLHIAADFHKPIL